jgi:hypothetical protein
MVGRDAGVAGVTLAVLVFRLFDFSPLLKRVSTLEVPFILTKRSSLKLKKELKQPSVSYPIPGTKILN